jgi:hypothetical protein
MTHATRCMRGFGSRNVAVVGRAKGLRVKHKAVSSHIVRTDLGKWCVFIAPVPPKDGSLCKRSKGTSSRKICFTFIAFMICHNLRFVRRHE